MSQSTVVSERTPLLPVVPVSHHGRTIGAGVLVAIAAALIWSFAHADINYGTVIKYLTDRSILSGMVNTLIISVLAQLLGIALGTVAAIMRLSPNPVTSAAAGAYIWFFRGTPVLVQLLVWYNLSYIFPQITVPGVGSWATNAVMTPFVAALLALGLNEGAYMAEIVRAGIGSVDPGQTEAAQALGLSPAKTMRRVILPQAMRVIVPPTGNEFINMLKTSSLAYAIQYGELLQSAVKIYSNNLQVIEVLFTISIWYLVLTTIFSIGQHFLERRLGRGQQSQSRGLLTRIAIHLRPGRSQ
jgi:polar amino acid transport system permease protein